MVTCGSLSQGVTARSGQKQRGQRQKQIQKRPHCWTLNANKLRKQHFPFDKTFLTGKKHAGLTRTNSPLSRAILIIQINAFQCYAPVDTSTVLFPILPSSID